MLFHKSQFIADAVQAFFKEDERISCHLVLIIHRIPVVYLNQFDEKVFCPLLVLILKCQADDGRFL